MEFTDTHVHIYDEAFGADLIDVIRRTKEASIFKIIMPGIDSSVHDNMIMCAERFKGFAFPAIGLHPTSVKANWKDELDFVAKNIDSYPFVAVGEIGIDGYWSKEYLKEQKIVFKEQLLMASKRDLPVIIHQRDSLDEIFSVMDQIQDSGISNLRGVFHAYSGSFETYQRIKRYGDFKIGIGGVVTFKNAHIARTLEDIPLEDILLETDAPWLAPAPYRGQRNESSYIPIIAQKIAQIKGVVLEDVARITTSNACSLFNLI